MDVIELYNRTTESTSVAFDSGPKKFVNDIAKQNYIADHLLAGKGDKEIYAGGPRIKDRLLLEERKALIRARPGVKREISNPTSHVNHSLHWAFYVGDLRWDEVEIAMNVNPTGMTKSGLKTYVKDVMEQKEQDLAANMINDFDDLFFATPDAALMEHLDQADGESPMVLSIPAVVNEETNGLYSGYDNTNGDFTTIMGINPENYPNWVPRQVEYDASSANIADMSVEDNLLAQLELLYMRLGFEPPRSIPMANGHFDPKTSIAKHLLVTGEAGAVAHRNVLRSNGDMFYPDRPNDGSFMSTLVGGVPVVRYPDLDSMNLYAPSSGSSLTTQDQAASPGARFYALNMDYIVPKFYSKKFFQKGKVKELEGTDGAFRQAVQVWCQTWYRSRKRHGILYPKTPS